jgi:hypothetical protein
MTTMKSKTTIHAYSQGVTRQIEVDTDKSVEALQKLCREGYCAWIVYPKVTK